MLTSGTILLLSLHLLCMNICSAGPLLCVWLNWRSQRSGSPVMSGAALRLAWWSLCTLPTGVAIGGLAGGAAWAGGDGRLVAVLPLFDRKIYWGLAELVCSLAWLGGFWFWLSWRPPTTSKSTLLHGLLAVLSSTNLWYHFPSLMTVLGKAAAGEYRLSQPVDSTQFRRLIAAPDVVAQSVHFVLASIAVSGVALICMTRPAPGAEAVYRAGGRIALLATALQLPTGIWLLFVTPAAAQNRLLGDNNLGTALFVASLLTAFYFLRSLVSIAFGEVDAKCVRRVAALTWLTVTLMTGVLHVMRG